MTYGVLSGFCLILYSPVMSTLMTKLSDSIAGFPSKGMLSVETIYVHCLLGASGFILPAPVKVVSVCCMASISSNSNT